MSAFRKLKLVTSQYPVLRGMIAYSVIWPTGSLIQQAIAGKRWETFDFKKCLHFSLYGSLFVAPTLYMWVRFSSRLWPATNLRAGIKKALIEQVTYGPMAMTSFFLFMPLLEGRTLQQAIEEVRVKVPQTWKVAICFWPIFQTINFSYIPERNRVPFVATGSLLWTIFLAYMNQCEMEKLKAKKLAKEKLTAKTQENLSN
ncbi:mpv17-like protein [Phlebotomus argentipes]|uniref:mpv17-like protein n=1 Tax=Phlebotomus argentipes TaxID=94469 RepID=UPI002892CFE7|nr:mpv17-like protein [Phlebotomus argentipes]